MDQVPEPKKVDEVRLSSGQLRDLVAAILAQGVVASRSDCTPEQAYEIYQQVRIDVQEKGLAPAKLQAK